MNDIGIIHVSTGDFCLVDADLFSTINRHKWAVDGKGYAFHYVRDEKGRKRHVAMHQVINGTPAGFETDHQNRFKLDNRRCNLKTATVHQNQGNSPKEIGNFSSTFKGVTWDTARNRWKAQIKDFGRNKFLGRFESEAEAAKAYNSAAELVFGNFARLNPL